MSVIVRGIIRIPLMSRRRSVDFLFCIAAMIAGFFYITRFGASRSFYFTRVEFAIFFERIAASQTISRMCAVVFVLIFRTVAVPFLTVLFDFDYDVLTEFALMGNECVVGTGSGGCFVDVVTSLGNGLAFRVVAIFV